MGTVKIFSENVSLGISSGTLGLFWSFLISFFVGLLASWLVSRRFRILSRDFIAKIKSEYFLVKGSQKHWIPNQPTRLMLELEYGEPEILSSFSAYLLFLRKSTFIEALVPKKNIFIVKDNGNKVKCNVYVIYRGRRRYIQKDWMINEVLNINKKEEEEKVSEVEEWEVRLDRYPLATPPLQEAWSKYR